MVLLNDLSEVNSQVGEDGEDGWLELGEGDVGLRSANFLVAYKRGSRPL